MSKSDEAFIADINNDPNYMDVSNLPSRLYIFPLNHVVLFPDAIVPLIIMPGPMFELIKSARSHSEYLGFIWGRFNDPDTLSSKDLVEIGVVGRILRVGCMSDGSYSVLVHCISRIRAVSFLKSEKLIAKVEYVQDKLKESRKLQALVRNIQNIVADMVSLTSAVPKEVITSFLKVEEPGKFADMLASHFQLPSEDKQHILEQIDVTDRLEALYAILVREMDIFELGQRIHEQIHESIETSQREYFLREQLSAIRKELGEEKDEIGLSIEVYATKIKESGLSEEAAARAQEQLDRLKVLPPDASEYHMIRTYLDWLCDLPWSKVTQDNLDLEHAEKTLQQDHYGLLDIKERIVEFLAVKKLKPDHQGQILCFLGPPGVGKTSLARSINRALGRKFYGFSLGGLKDEAEIKGHRRTYVGAMPGKILQGLKSVGVRNPVFVLDEIDKLGSDWRGDPSSAMLEVLDPSINDRFMDHYLDVPFDLSDVMFIATANDASTIPKPLLDRMEVIELAGYIDDEKYQIAKRHIIPKQIELHGLNKNQISFQPSAVKQIIREYTREAGVRGLEREIAKVCRKNALKVAKGEQLEAKISPSNITAFLGQPVYTDEVISRKMLPGVAVGLAWTQCGGEILFIESTKMIGTGQLKLTGQLGEVMTESVQIAFSYVRANLDYFGINPDLFKKTDYHVHFPAGAIPKDGPSAGITITTSLLSLLLQKPVPQRLAMTGEITLTGNVLPVGGIKEKVIAAKRAGAKNIAMCKQNKRDVEEIDDLIRSGLSFFYVETYKELFKLLFVSGIPKTPVQVTETKNDVKKATKVLANKTPASDLASVDNDEDDESKDSE